MYQVVLIAQELLIDIHKRCNFLYRENKQKKGNVKNYMKTTVDVMFTQVNVKRGKKIFKQQAVAAMIKELVQMDRGAVDGKPVVIPIDANLLT